MGSDRPRNVCTSVEQTQLEKVCRVCTASRVEEWSEVCASVSGVRHILTGIDRQVDEQEKQRRLVDIYSRLDTRSFTALNTTTFTVSQSRDLIQQQQQLQQQQLHCLPHSHLSHHSSQRLFLTHLGKSGVCCVDFTVEH